MRKFFRNYFANKPPLFVANSADLPAKWYFLYIFITACRAFPFLFVYQRMPCGAVLSVAEGTDGGFLFVRMSLYALSVSKSRRMKRKGRRRKHRGGFPGVGSNKMTFCQTNRSTVPVFAPKCEVVTGKLLLGQFAKSTLMPFGRNVFPFGHRIAR